MPPGQHVESSRLELGRVARRRWRAPAAGSRGTRPSRRSRSTLPWRRSRGSAGRPASPGRPRDRARRSKLLAAEHEAGARAGERLVRRRRDEVAVRHRVRMQPGRDQAGEVRHVAEQVGADLVRDFAEALGLDRPRIGGAAADDELRPVRLRQLPYLVVVDEARLAADAVVDDRVQAARRSSPSGRA